ncbi:DUF2812 domain-containing protein [Candidatus Contubernalis alkaliaceticus]|uniref:DUF2812 domain-containing protein n=1 Tax=Candidatus Contubernalis alkaliaceticus TaxID=338645 RepID=UPI001F4BDBA8|nr:DUF2812 domain-containing protein [Candidatus Contubernalis alkalaceticus]UNC91063.1 DUF2812 domain-containing protein [Candidatus Contubernalis alkalaceticus]
MKSIKTKWRLWWGWNPEKIECWLEEMEKKGWNLFQVDYLSLRFHFQKGEARQIRYCVDFQTEVDDNYFSLFTDDNWELFREGVGGWYIWRKPYKNEKPDIYTDKASLIDRNSRLLPQFITLFIISLAFLIMMILDVQLHFISFNKIYLISLIPLHFVSSIMMGFITIQIMRYNKRIKQSTD